MEQDEFEAWERKRALEIRAGKQRLTELLSEKDLYPFESENEVEGLVDKFARKKAKMKVRENIKYWLKKGIPIDIEFVKKNFDFHKESECFFEREAWGNLKEIVQGPMSLLYNLDKKKQERVLRQLIQRRKNKESFSDRMHFDYKLIDYFRYKEDGSLGKNEEMIRDYRHMENVRNGFYLTDLIPEEFLPQNVEKKHIKNYESYIALLKLSKDSLGKLGEKENEVYHEEWKNQVRVWENEDGSDSRNFRKGLWKERMSTHVRDILNDLDVDVDVHYCLYEGSGHIRVPIPRRKLTEPQYNKFIKLVKYAYDLKQKELEGNDR